jgi:hypothetical protein
MTHGKRFASTSSVNVLAVVFATVWGTVLNFFPTSVQRSSSLTRGAQMYLRICQGGYVPQGVTAQSRRGTRVGGGER